MPTKVAIFLVGVKEKWGIEVLIMVRILGAQMCYVLGGLPVVFVFNEF